MIRGPKEISINLGIARDASWESMFSFNGNEKTSSYFYKPYIAGEKFKGSSESDLGYWSPCFSLDKSRANVITYSIPIISDSGELYGVLGIDITEDYIAKMLPDREINKEKEGSYVLGVENNNELSFKDKVSNGG